MTVRWFVAFSPSSGKNSTLGWRQCSVTCTSRLVYGISLAVLHGNARIVLAQVRRAYDSTQRGARAYSSGDRATGVNGATSGETREKKKKEEAERSILSAKAGEREGSTARQTVGPSE